MIYMKWWEQKLPLKEIIPKHFEITNDIMASEFNIAYVGDKVKIKRKKLTTEKERTCHFFKGEYVVEEILTKN